MSRASTRAAEQLAALEPFIDEGLITEPLYVVKSGKEATVYCCRAAPKMETELLAAKVYRSRDHRSFKNDSVYREGRVILNARTRRAVEKKTRFGREAEGGMWTYHEYEVLGQVYAAGLDVPRPIRAAESAMLMQYLGDDEEAAAPLCYVELEPRDARRVFDRLVWNVERLLSLNQVHGDLSPFNVLYWDEQAWIIDFPQAVDARFNRNACDLLERDLENLCDYFTRYGIRADPARLAHGMWTRYKYAQL